MLSKKEVAHIAKLARLGLSKKEIQKMQKDLSAILNYIEKLKEVNTKEVKPTSHPFALVNIMREDRARKESPERISQLIKLSPQREKGYIKVKSVWT